jgi:hypothetical protein
VASGFPRHHYLKLDRLLVFYPREKKYPLAERLDVIPLTLLLL